MQDNLSPLHLLSLRWAMLQAIEAASVAGATDAMCLDVATAAYPGTGLDRVRVELEYLESAGLASLQRSEIRPWLAKLTASGWDVVNYMTPAPEGIARPDRQAGA